MIRALNTSRFHSIKGSRAWFHATTSSNAKVLCTDGVDEVCVNIFKQRGHQVDFIKTPSEADYIKIIGDYDGLVVRSASKVTAAILKHATKMRVIGRAGVGVDNINVPEATKHGIMVMNTPGGNTVSTAQLALSLLCSMARNIPAADISVKQGLWDRKSFTGVELNGKTLGIIGCGRIGQVVASCAKTIGMNVIGYDPIMKAEELTDVGIKKEELEGIWAKSDFITVHTPLIPETTNLLNDTTLAKCKTGVRIVNCARGGIVDEAALLRALDSGKVAGAALDVFTSEPPKENLKPLIAHPKLVCTPHLGASTEEAQINVARDIAQQMCDVFDQKDYYGVMNVPYMQAAGLPPMKPFMRLAEILGVFQAQLSSSRVSKVVLKTWGGRDTDITTKQARQLLMAQALKGVIKHSGIGMVPDLISAPIIAKEVGIVSTISDEAPETTGSPYWNLLSVEVTREDGSSGVVSGVVFGSTPHIVTVDDYSNLFAFKPDGSYILSFRNEDRPGAISEVLEVLNNVNVNVASLNVGRLQTDPPTVGQKALCFMALDDDVPTNAMAALKGLSYLDSVCKIELR